MTTTTTTTSKAVSLNNCHDSDIYKPVQLKSTAFTTLDLPNLCWNKSYSLFSCSSVSITLEILFREPQDEILGAENMLFQSCD